jgi:hypothetical protein
VLVETQEATRYTLELKYLAAARYKQPIQLGLVWTVVFCNPDRKKKGNSRVQRVLVLIPKTPGIDIVYMSVILGIKP